ncbi:MAG: hypothetical protein V1859_09385 [archaeon]
MAFVGRSLLFVVLVAAAITIVLFAAIWLFKWVTYRSAAKTLKWKQDNETKAKKEAEEILKGKKKKE